MGLSKEEWCDFHRTLGHSTEGCWTLKTQLEKLVQEGHLGRPSCDEPMVISVIVAEYKVERVLIDQGSSTNILYWSTFRKMGLRHLTEYSGTLYDFAGERVPIKGIVELETIFGERSGVITISILYTMVDAEASYNIIMGRPTLNRLGVIVSTYHLYMKFPVSWEVGSVWADSRVARRCYEDSLRVGVEPIGVGCECLRFGFGSLVSLRKQKTPPDRGCERNPNRATGHPFDKDSNDLRPQGRSAAHGFPHMKH
ncbi:hypothetical protein CR513_19309, partial [Mucuna pruriens]